MFSVRIVTTDHYMAPPLRGLDVQYADQRGAEVKKVPVVRIFGATPAGQKTCMHVHGVFPYLYVPYDGTAPLDRYLRQFASSLDKAINVAQGHGQSTIQHVYKIVLVSGIAMYGYHDKEQQFLKIYLYNPAMIRKAADLLLGGAVLNKAFQPHEAHIPYTLQLFIDYNLYGMNMINVGAVKFRRRGMDDNDNPVIVRDVSYLGSQGSDEGLGSDPKTPVSFTGLLNRSGTMTPSRRTWDRENIPSELYLDMDVERQSTCELEVDVVAADILNRLEVNDNIGANPGLAALWEDERQRRREKGESEGDIAPPDSQERVDIERAESEVELENRLRDIVLQQLAYSESQSQSELEESQEIPATPASAVEIHLSQMEEDLLQSSQETVILDGEEFDGERPVVNLNSIHRVVSSSHSFCEVRARNEDVSVEDKPLLDILASLAEEADTPPSSQVAAVTQVTALEEQDSILSQVSQPRDKEVEEREAEEVLEMSQRIWDEDMTLPSQEQNASPMKTNMEEYDLAGLDDTWQGSQIEPDSDDGSDSDVIPQLDGQADEKPKSPRKRGPKRLGVTGPVRYPQGMPPQMYPPGYMTNQPYPGMPPNPQYSGNYYGNYGPPGPGYRQWRPGMPPGQVPPPQNPLGMMPNSQMQQSPRMQQSPGMQQQSPRMQQQSPGMLQSPGNIQHPHQQTSLGVLQNPHMQQSPGHHHSPGTQQSPGMLQSPVGNFSPQGAAGWDQAQNYSSPNSPPVVSVYGAEKSQQSASIASSQATGISSTSSQYQNYPANAYGYHQAIPNTTATTHASSTVQSGYGSEMIDTPQQVSPGCPPDGQKRYQLAPHFHPGYGQQPYPYGGIRHPLAYSVAQDLSQGAVPKSSAETVSRNFSVRNRADMPSVNAQQISPQWQQRAAVLSTQAQRFQTPHSVVGNNGSQAVSVPSSTTADTIRNYAGYKNSLTIQATGSLENQFPNVPPNSAVHETHRRNASFPGNAGERSIENILQKDWISPNANTSKNAHSQASQGNSVMNSSPGANGNAIGQSRQNLNVSEENTAQDRQSPEWIAIPQNAQVSNDSKSEASVSDIRRTDPHNQLFYPQHPGNVNAQNYQNVAQNYSQWTNYGVAQPVNTSVPNSVVHHIPHSSPEIVKNKSQEALKSPPKPLMPPAEGPISRYYRKKLASATTGSIGEMKSPEGNGSSQSTTPLSSPVNSVTSPPNNLSSPVNTGENASTALHKLLLQHQGSELSGLPAGVAPETSSSGSGEIVPGSKRSSLTSLLLEEENEKPIVWDENSVFQHQLFNKGSVEKHNQNHMNRHSLDSSTGINVSANPGSNMIGAVGVNRNSISRHSLDSSSGVNLSSHLSDNSQDLFSERSRTLSETGSLKNNFRLGNDSTAGDDSVSVFSDGMNEVQSGDNQSTVDDCRKSVPSSESVESGKQDDLSSLSDLRSFVGSVQKGSDYGANFQRSDFHLNTEEVVRQEPTAMNNAGGHFPVGFKDNGLVNQSLTNVNKVAAQSQLQSNLGQPGNMMPKPKRKYTRKDPNASPVKRTPKMPDIPGMKKRRGRPKKDSFVNMQNPMLAGQGNFMNNTLHENIPGQQFYPGYQNQQLSQQNFNYQNYQQGYHPQTSYSDQASFQNQQFYQQQTLNQTAQNQVPFFPGAETQQAIQNKPVQNKVPLTAEEEVQNATAFLVQNEQDLQSQPSFLGELMDENDSFDFQQPSSSCSESVIAENDQIAGQPGIAENREANTDMNMDVNNDSFDYNEMRNRASQEMQEFHKQQEMLSNSIIESETLKLFKSAAQKEKEETLKETNVNIKSLYVKEVNVASPHVPSSAYTFQFKVPTPVYKRLKLRLSPDSREALRNFEIVRMHPKDARKYSLMKIGKEMVQLYKLSDNEIGKLQEDLISGKEVFSIPPAIRQVGNFSDNSNVVEGKEIAEMSPSVFQENQKYLTQLDQDGNNVQTQKRKKITASMFKNRNIANIPHLKKYRAGFPYFGKGNIGKKVPSKQSHPVLSPELEEDNDVVIKDVSLIDASDGKLTPIKSRTPVAGRSPAHAGSHILEGVHKEYLDQKLKDFEGDLELNSQTNEPQIFDEGESSLFDDEKQVNEFEGSTDTEEIEMSEIADGNEARELYDISKQVLENEDMKENNFEADANESDILSDGTQSQSIMENTGIIDDKIRNEDENKEESGGEKAVDEMNLTNQALIDRRKEKINKIKQEISKKAELLERVKEALIDIPEKHARSRSNSIETYSSCKSTGSSRRDSLSNSVDGRARRLSSVESYIADKFKKEKRKRSSSSSSSRNKHSRKSSVDDQENKHKRRKTHSKKKKKKKHQSHSGSDSDGIPGVDYIVIGFKGCKEMRVGLHKLDIDESDSVSAEEMLKFVSKKEKLKPKRHKNDNSKDFEVPLIPKISNSQPKSPASNSSVKPNTFSGFSAEFAKFLAQGRNENEKENEVLQRIKSMPAMQRQSKNDLVKPDIKSNTEDNSSKGEPGSRGTLSENSEGSENEHGESSTSDMCLSTNHTLAHENISTLNSVDDVFLGEVSEKSDFVTNEEEMVNKLAKKHSWKKKKGNTIHDRMSRAFVGKSKRRKKHKHSPRKSSKFSNSLNALYDATIENLQSSPVIENYAGPIKLKINLKSLRRTPDFDLYSDDVESDYDAPFCDTMYKLAWYSPPESETGELSPPQPLSPEQMSDIENLENNVKKLPPSIIHGSSTPKKNKNRSGRSTPVRSNGQNLKDDRLNMNDVKMTVNANSPLMSQAALREERLTFADIQKTLKTAKSSEIETEKNLKEVKIVIRDIMKANSEKETEKCLREDRITLSDIKKTVNKANLSEMEGEKQLKEQKLTLSQIKKVMNETNNSLDASETTKTIKANEENMNRNTNTDKEMNILKESQPFNKENIIDIGETDLKKPVGDVESVTEEEKHEETKLTNKVPENAGVHNKFEEVALSHFPPLTVNVEDNELFADDESESVDSNRSNEENISPPDLGPPIIPRFSPRQYPAVFHRNDPPPLTIGKETIYVNTQDSSAGNFLNTPPNLVSCKSPGSTSFISISPRQLFASPNQNSGALKRRPGHSPAACSSSSSINVVHSEQFSDISDEESDNEIKNSEHDIESQHRMIHEQERTSEQRDIDSKYEIKTQGDSSTQQDIVCDENFSKPPTLLKTRTNIINYLSSTSASVIQGNTDKETKLKDIAEFEERNIAMNIVSEKEMFNRMQADRDRMRTNVIEFERKHEAIDMSRNCTVERNTGKLDCKRRHSVPLFNTNDVAPYINHNSTNMNAHFVPNSSQDNLPVDYSIQNFESCKFSQKRQFAGSSNPKYMALDSEPQNGYKRNPALDGRNLNLPISVSRSNSLEAHNPFETPSVKHSLYAVHNMMSPPGFHRNVSDTCVNNLRNNPNFSMHRGNVFERFSQNFARLPNEQTSNEALLQSQRSTYNICRNRRISDSIIRSISNHCPNEKNGLDSQPLESLHKIGDRNTPNIPFTQLGTGGNKEIRHTGLRQSGKGSQSSSGINDEQSMSDKSSGRGGGDNKRNGDNRDTDKLGSLQTPASCHVITPLTAPPAKECVNETANQYGLPSVQAKEAFYGNPKDAPERPREEGGQVLKVSSNMVKCLREFDTVGKTEGLLSWRNLFCAKENLFSSQQEDNACLCDRLEKEPALKYALTGDKNIVVTPCLLPPPRSKVKEWCKGRALYKALKRQTGIPKIRTESVESDSETSRTQEPDNFAADGQLEDVRLNLFTGRREVVHEHSDLNEEDKPPVLVREEPDLVEVEDSTSKSREGKVTRNRPDDDEEIAVGLSPSIKQPRLDDLSQLHSTPMVKRRSSADLFEASYTPIATDRMSPMLDVNRLTPAVDSSGRMTPTQEGEDQKEEQSGDGFLTPKRIRPPLRRLSTNTETSLRRAIINTQMKQQFCTPSLHKEASQIEGPTPKNSFGFKVSQQNFQDAKALHENQYLTVLSVELHVESRGDLKPDPEFDSIRGIFYSIFNDVPPESGARHQTGAMLVDPESTNQIQPSTLAANKKERKVSHDPVPGTSKAHDHRSCDDAEKKTFLQKAGVTGLEVNYVKDEEEMIKAFIDLVNKWNPDILVGYEIQLLSWGYLLQRASTLNTNMAVAISRIPTAKTSSHMSAEKDEYGADHASEIHIAGRIVLNLWRLLRHEVSLNIYTYENVAFHVLHRRVPLFSFRNLTSWFKHRTHVHRWKVVEHYVSRSKGNLEMMDQLDIIGRTSEFARVFGIEFYHVLSRGSQYRVESMMLRVAKPMNYIPVSPSVQQRARMKAPECIPLTLEPESRFYTDPVVVLDFQSLYPSIMIAYNYCFATCMGRVDWLSKAHEGPIEFGCTSLNMPPSVLKKRQDNLTYSPNGVAFVKQSVKRGVLPVMVEEILKTRLMVKKAMKSYKGDKTLSRMLDARQLGLKLIANVTYGYTGANFSGRMPCIEVGDSIVRKARETLERSIKLVEETPKWGAKVIYGDTDSMFLLMKGKSKDEAFKIGQEIADTVTKMFPKPVKLKFEKVYLPCVLQTKKRYVGFMYETPDQKEPVFDAKGIETVRRDSCPAVSKILERSIKILFQFRDVSQLKSYVQHQCQKLMEGTVSLQDCIFAKEFRGVSGYRPGACVPALEIAKKLIRQDRRAEPRVGERVPYVIVYGSPGLPLIQLVKQPMELLQDGSLRLNATYYITKQILPPLSRFLSLLGVDVFSWYQEMPHTSARALAQTASPRKGTISQYFATSNCPICDEQTKQPICQQCMREPQMVCVTLNDKISSWERLQDHLNKVCSICMGCSESATVKSCISLDCPILYRQSRAQADVSRASTIREILAKVFK